MDNEKYNDLYRALNARVKKSMKGVSWVFVKELNRNTQDLHHCLLKALKEAGYLHGKESEKLKSTNKNIETIQKEMQELVEQTRTKMDCARAINGSEKFSDILEQYDEKLICYEIEAKLRDAAEGGNFYAQDTKTSSL